MRSVLGVFGIVISIFAIGCAAPRTQVVASRQHEAIDQHLFKEGDRVWITYQDKIDTVATKSGFVLDSDNDSVRLDVGRKRVVDVEYRRIQTLSRPAQNHSYVGLSVGRLPVLVPHPRELPSAIRLTGAGVFFRHWDYLNKSFEGSFLVGGKGPGVSSWMSISGSAFFYTTIPKTYFFLGMGVVRPRPIEKFNSYYGRHQSNSDFRYLEFFRIGAGITNSISDYYNIRIEAELMNALYSTLIKGSVESESFGLTGLRICFERRVH